MKEVPAELTREGVTLHGTWTLPDAPRGLVICVHGSGPMDRNQNGKGGKLETFRVMAEALRGSGFAVLRYDKRGVGASGGDYAQLGQDDLIADLRGWIAQATARGMGPIWLLGHSEGTALATVAAEGHEIAGLMLLCPYVTPGGEILIQQAARADRTVAELPGFQGMLARTLSKILGTPSQMQARLVAKLERTKAPMLRVGLRKVPVRWLRDFVQMDVAAVHARNRLPTLVVVANRDVQCPPADGAKIAAMNPNATLVEIDDLSHLLRHTTTDDFADYMRQMKAPNDPRPVQAVLDWLEGQAA